MLALFGGRDAALVYKSDTRMWDGMVRWRPRRCRHDVAAKAQEIFMTRYLSLLPFLLLVTLAAVFGTQFEPGSWHTALQKPSWNPPNALFGPVWTVLYVLIAVAGWRVWRRGLQAPLALWGVQLLLNALWSWLFFGLHEPWIALLDIVVLLLVIAAFIARSWHGDRIAAWLFVPYAAWVAFATALNGWIAWMN